MSNSKDIQNLRSAILATGRSTDSAGKALSGLAQVILQISRPDKDRIKIKGEEKTEMTKLQSSAKNRIKIKRSSVTDIQEKLYEAAFTSGQEEAMSMSVPVTDVLTRFEHSQSNNYEDGSTCTIRYRHQYYIDQMEMTRELRIGYHIRRESVTGRVEYAGAVVIPMAAISSRDRGMFMHQMGVLVQRAAVQGDLLSFLDELTQFLYSPTQQYIEPNTLRDLTQILPQNPANFRAEVLSFVGYEEYEPGVAVQPINSNH